MLQSSSNGGGVTEPAAFDDDEFQKPKSNEKKDKKAKRAEEKRRQKEAKRAAAAAEAAQADYIPGAPRPQPERTQVHLPSSLLGEWRALQVIFHRKVREKSFSNTSSWSLRRKCHFLKSFHALLFKNDLFWHNGLWAINRVLWSSALNMLWRNVYWVILTNFWVHLRPFNVWFRILLFFWTRAIIFLDHQIEENHQNSHSVFLIQT